MQWPWVLKSLIDVGAAGAARSAIVWSELPAREATEVSASGIRVRLLTEHRRPKPRRNRERRVPTLRIELASCLLRSYLGRHEECRAVPGAQVDSRVPALLVAAQGLQLCVRTSHGLRKLLSTRVPSHSEARHRTWPEAPLRKIRSMQSGPREPTRASR